MKISELTPEQVPPGTRIVVIAVAPSEAEKLGYCNDTERLMMQTGTVRALIDAGGLFAQLRVDWDDLGPGTLMLARHDEIEVLP